MEARNPEEIERGFGKMKKDRAHAAIVLTDAFYTTRRRQIAELGVRHKVPTIYAQREYVEAGGLISYGTNLADVFRRAATYVDKILKGVKPAELPIEQPTRVHLAINRKTARALGITISKELLFRADEVIE